MTEEETPESLLKFFEALDSAGAEEGECQIHYGCQCVIRKGRLAAERLVAAQQGAPTPPATEPPNEPEEQGDEQAAEEAGPTEDQLKIEGLTEELTDAKEEYDRAVAQNLELVGENGKLKEKVQLLQKQVNRLYDKVEMSSILDQLESVPGKQETTEPSEAETGTEGGEEPTLPDALLESEGAVRVTEMEAAEATGSEESNDGDDGHDPGARSPDS